MSQPDGPTWDPSEWSPAAWEYIQRSLAEQAPPPEEPPPIEPHEGIPAAEPPPVEPPDFPTIGGGSIGGGLGSLLNSHDAIVQIFLWRVIGEMLTAGLQPFLTGLAAKLNSTFQFVPISPDEAATMVVRGWISQDSGADEAKQGGVNPDNFAHMVNARRLPPAPDTLAEMFRKGIIEKGPSGPGGVTFVDGIQQGDTGNEWAGALLQNALSIPSPGDVIGMAIRGYLAGSDAQALYEKVGADPQYYQLQYDLAGTPPSPGELQRMANRGIIPLQGEGADSVSLDQGIRESHYKDKWIPVFEKLREYMPPPRTVVAMLRDGALTQAQAAGYLADYGLPAPMIAQYLGSATSQKLATAKSLSEGVTVKLFTDHLIPEAEAVSLLGAIGYDADEAAFILQVAVTQSYQANVNSAVTHTRTLYVGHKITRTTATGILSQLGIASGQVDELVGIWDLEVQALVKSLTEGQIVDAWEYQIIDEGTALTLLQQLGYDAYDAWLVLSVKNKGPLPGEPGGNPSPPPPPPTTETAA